MLCKDLIEIFGGYTGDNLIIHLDGDPIGASAETKRGGYVDLISQLVLASDSFISAMML